MPRPAYLQLDNLDDRKEIFYLIQSLSPRQRLHFLAWCCSQCTLPHSQVHPRVRPTTRGEVLEIWFDLWMLANQYDLDMERALERLVEMVRRRDVLLRSTPIISLPLPAASHTP